jgi:hypothetical protein
MSSSPPFSLKLQMLVQSEAKWWERSILLTYIRMSPNNFIPNLISKQHWHIQQDRPSSPHPSRRRDKTCIEELGQTHGKCPLIWWKRNSRIKYEPKWKFFVNIEWFLHRKLNCSWKLRRNWNVALVLLKRSWWAGFNEIYYLVKIWIQNVGDIDFLSLLSWYA